VAGKTKIQSRLSCPKPDADWERFLTLKKLDRQRNITPGCRKVKEGPGTFSKEIRSIESSSHTQGGGKGLSGKIDHHVLVVRKKAQQRKGGVVRPKPGRLGWDKRKGPSGQTSRAPDIEEHQTGQKKTDQSEATKDTSKGGEDGTRKYSVAAASSKTLLKKSKGVRGLKHTAPSKRRPEPTVREAGDCGVAG